MVVHMLLPTTQDHQWEGGGERPSHWVRQWRLFATVRPAKTRRSLCPQLRSSSLFFKRLVRNWQNFCHTYCVTKYKCFFVFFSRCLECRGAQALTFYQYQLLLPFAHQSTSWAVQFSHEPTARMPPLDSMSLIKQKRLLVCEKTRTLTASLVQIFHHEWLFGTIMQLWDQT